MTRNVFGVMLLLTIDLQGIEYTFQKIADTSAGSPFRGFKLGVIINDGGTVGFVGVTQFTGNEATAQGVYTSSGGELKKIADTTGSFNDLAIGGINRTGAVAFLARDRNFSYGIFSGDGGPLNTIVLHSDATPLAPTSLPPDIGPDGAVAFVANGRVFVQRGAERRVVFDNRTGPRAGTAPSAVQWNSRGDLSFLLTHSGFERGGVFYERGGIITTIADDSGTVNFTENGLASINDNGIAAFRGWTKALPRQQGVFTVSEGGRAITVQASPLGSLVVAGGMVGINNQGVVAYSLARIGDEVPAIVTGPDLPKDKVIRVGDDLFGSKVSDLMTANFVGGRFLNNLGQIAFIYRLQTGVLGIAVATPVSPGTIDGRPVLPAGSIVNAAALTSPLNSRLLTPPCCPLPWTE
jgi:hypothetical protein